MRKKNLSLLILSALFTMAFILTGLAREKRGDYGSLPPLSVLERIEMDVYTPSNARAVTGEWIQDLDTGRWWYRHADGSCTKDDWEKIGDKWYHFDSDGWMQTGWFTDVDGNIYYLDDDEGFMRIKWVLIEGSWYYFGEHGVMQTGWFEDEGYYYYCDLANGEMYSDCWDTIRVNFNGTMRNLVVHFAVSGEADFASDVEPCEDMYYTFNDHILTESKDSLTYMNTSTRATNSVISSAHLRWYNGTGVSLEVIETDLPVLAYVDATLSASVMAQVNFPVLAPEHANWSGARIEVGQNFTELDLDKRVVVIEHELGHFFGLSHRYLKNASSVMFAFAGDDQSHATLADFNTYNHLYDGDE